MNPYDDYDYFELEENFEFNKGFNKLIDQEVEKRVSERTKVIEKDIEIGKKDSEEANELRKKIGELSRQLAHDKKLHMKEGAKEERVKLFGGYDVGDYVWTVKSEYIHEDCLGCSGTGKVNATIKDKTVEIKCLDCNGYKRKGKSVYSPLQCVVDVVRLKYHKWESECRRSYEASYYENPRHRAKEIELGSSEVYKTEEECLQVAEEKNNKSK